MQAINTVNYQYHNMGGQHSDPAVNIQILLRSKYLNSGQIAEGTIVLTLSEPRNFTHLSLAVQCKERSQWVKNYGHVIIVYGNMAQTYGSDYVLQSLSSCLNPGTYSYPFRILLPDSLPATLELSTNNYVSYTLTASLGYQYQSIYKYQATIPLVIQQPQRISYSLESKCKSKAKCWSCCCLFAEIDYQMTISSNFINNGDSINCSVLLTNSQGKQPIETVSILLNEYIKQISDWDYQNVWVNNSYELYTWQGRVNIEASQSIEAILKIPQQIPFCTSIGQTIERYYLVEAVYDLGCCSNNASIGIPVVVNTSLMVNQSAIDESSPFYYSVDSSHQQSPVAQLRPYIYCPKKGIVHINQILDQSRPQKKDSSMPMPQHRKDHNLEMQRKSIEKYQYNIYEEDWKKKELI